MPFKKEAGYGRSVSFTVDGSPGRLFRGVLFTNLLVFSIPWSPSVEGASIPSQAETGASGPSNSNNQADRFNLMQQKLQLVETILEKTQRRYEDENWVRPQLEITKQLIESARLGLAQNNFDNVEASLDEALRLMVELSRGARRTTPEQRLRRYQQLLDETLTLRRAIDHVLSQKGNPASEAAKTAEIDGLIDSARGEASQGRHEDANKLLASAYEKTSMSLANLRANETLEHRLVFKTPEEEYRYEKNRFKSSEILLRLIVAERNPGPTSLEEIRGHVDKAVILDAEAVRFAGRGEYSVAIKKQEAAVDSLTRALRRAGLPIP